MPYTNRNVPPPGLFISWGVGMGEGGSEAHPPVPGTPPDLLSIKFQLRSSADSRKYP